MGATHTVSLLFTDLVGSTALATRLGPTGADALRREHFGILRDAIGECGGEEVKSLGDGVMASFEGVRAALACAVGMQQSVERRNRRASPPLDVRIGLAVGDAIRETGDWFGQPAIEAARLCGAAEGGQILVTQAVHLLSSGAEGLALRAVGPLELKGLPERFAAWSVEWEPLPPDAEALPLPPRLRDVPTAGFVGRVVERDLLADAWGRARNGDGRLVLVCGEPGIGKTRLAAHLAHEARRGGALVLYGRCDDDAGVPYQPWREMLGHLVEAGPDELLRRHVDDYGGELARLAPRLRDRVAGVPPPQPTDAETERYLLFGATVGLLGETTALGPILLVLDDLHWATRPTLAVLRHLLAAMPSMPLLVVATYRDPSGARTAALAELLGDLRREPRVERLVLEGLGEREAETLLATTAGHDLDLRGAALARELHRETGGNPFFLGEMVRHLAEAGAIRRDSDGRLTAAPVLTSLQLPASIQEVVSGRVARLGPGAERLLRMAAVIGREFDVELLARVADVDEDVVLDALEAAAGAALLGEVPDRAGRFQFVHALVTHALSRELTGARRVRLHERIAHALEDRATAGAEAPFGELAHHWAAVPATSAQERARDHAAAAGRAATAQLAPDEAVRWFEQALALHGRLPTPDPLTRRELRLELGEAQLLAGLPEFRETLLDVAGEARAAGDGDRLVQAALANSRGYFSAAGSVDVDRIAVLEAALGHAHPADPRRARVLALLAAELIWSGDDTRRRSLSDEAVELARGHGDRAALAHVLTLRVATVWWPETLAERLEITAELLALTDALGDPVLRFWALVWRAMSAVQKERVADADRCLETLRRLSARLGRPRLRFVLGTQEAWRAQLAGRLEDAEQLADAALALGTRAGEPDALSLYAAQLGPIRWQQGRLDEATELLGQNAREVPGVSIFGALHALAELEAGREHEARRGLERAGVGGFAGIPSDPVRLGSLVVWAEVAARLGARPPAAALLARLEPWRNQIVLDALGTLGSAARAVGMLAAALGRPDEAGAHFAHALDVHERIGAPSLAARTLLDWGASLRSADLLARAVQAARAQGLTALERRARDATAAPVAPQV